MGSGIIEADSLALLALAGDIARRTLAQMAALKKEDALAERV